MSTTYDIWFPLSPLVKVHLQFFNLAPGQLMPNIWHTLLCLEVTKENVGLQFGLKDLLHSYFMKEYEGEKCSYVLV